MVPPDVSNEVSANTVESEVLDAPAASSTTLQFWITSFAILFALAKLLDWLHGFHLTMPVFVAGGGLLAIASNYDKRILFPFWPQGSGISNGTNTAPSMDAASHAASTASMGASTAQTMSRDWQTNSDAQTVDVEPQLPPFNN